MKCHKKDMSFLCNGKKNRKNRVSNILYVYLSSQGTIINRGSFFSWIQSTTISPTKAIVCNETQFKLKFSLTAYQPDCFHFLCFQNPPYISSYLIYITKVYMRQGNIIFPPHRLRLLGSQFIKRHYTMQMKKAFSNNESLHAA